MSQRMALVFAGGITAFILVLLGGVILTVRLTDNVQARSAAQPAPAQPAAGSSKPQTALNADQASQVALNMAPGARVANPPDLVNFQGTVAYEITLDQGVVYVDANNGRVLSSTLNSFTGSGQFGGRQLEREQEGGERD